MYKVAINNKILREWQSRYPNLPIFTDGVVSPSKYWSEPVKVAICLKEVIAYKSGNPLLGTQKPKNVKAYSVSDYLYNTGGSDSISYINECKLAEILLEKRQIHSCTNAETRKSIFKRIAHIELSKIGGTELQSDWYSTIINDNKDLIGKQLSNLDANYYVVCGQPSWDIVKSVINLETYKYLIVDVPYNGGKMEFWTNPSINKTLILMYHPSDLRFSKQLDMITAFVNA